MPTTRGACQADPRGGSSSRAETVRAPESRPVTSELVLPTAAAAPTPSSPFVGLEPYRERDAEFFFGRTDDRRIIAANLRSCRLTLLYGASGVGKSSVLRAGVLDMERKRILAEAAARGDDSRSPAPVAALYFGAWREPDPMQTLLAPVRNAAAEAVEQPE